jgi:predicted alpha-1,2-mannosidase
MVQLSPDTRLEGWDGCSGYHYTDNVVYGFSHTHLSGTGIADYCDILFMPTVGDVRLANGYPDKPDEGYASRFSKSREKAQPGYYEVYLDDYNIDVALTCTERVGLHRYTYPPGREANVIVDLQHRDKVLDSRLAVVGPDEIEGYRVSSSWAKEQHVYFVARFSQPFTSYGIARDDSVLEGAADVSGTNVKAFFRFGTEVGAPVLVKVGISAVDTDGARRNLDAEIAHWNFAAVRDRADAKWEKALSKIVVAGGETERGGVEQPAAGDWENRKRVFYTALYHTMIAPNLIIDVDGRYRGTDLQVHETDRTDIYTVFSLWDTFRATHPLYTIIERDRTLDFIRTFLLQYTHGGQLPVWELAGNYTGTMIGYHSIPVIVDAYVKGIRDFNMDIAFGAMLEAASREDRGLGSYKHQGYISASDEAESVSKTLEYAYDDWCLSQALLGVQSRKLLFSKFIQRAQFFKNLFDPSTGFMRARTESGWFSPFDPAEVNFNYTEANAWQYTFFAPHDVSGLIDLMGGAAQFETRLDALFDSSSNLTGREQADITGLIGQYAHGNEPSHHVAYLYNYVGVPWKTQRRVRQIMDELYLATPEGLAGNEDCGQLSAWYVLSAMGFYSVTPALSYYAIGTPLFERVTIHLENGNEFVISAADVSDKNIFIQSATLNGQPHTRSYLTHAAIMAGGELAFVMGPEPNQDWASRDGDIPVAEIHDEPITPVPYFEAQSATFTDSLVVDVGVACDDCDIMITIEQKDTGDGFTRRYGGPVVLRQSSKIVAVATGQGRVASRAGVAEYVKIPGGRNITLGTSYAGQYSGGGDHALIDYRRGSGDFRTGTWQGYEDVDLDAVVDLGEELEIERISAGFLQDIRSWIWFPKEIEFAVSPDGTDFRVLATIDHDFSDDEYGAFLKEFSTNTRTRARYVRVRAKNYGKCPGWHPGAGGKTWIFVDEIVVE